MDSETERRLVGRLKGGDESAFDLVYEAYRRPLFAFLYRLTRNRDAAEDALEETWLRLVGRIDTLRDETQLGSWLFAVARNLAFDFLRARAFDGETVGNTDLAGSLADTRPSPYDTAAAHELDRRLERGLLALPPSLREVLLLVGVRGMLPSDAAVVCNVRADALRQRLHRARDMLARWLEEQDRAG